MHRPSICLEAPNGGSIKRFLAWWRASGLEVATLQAWLIVKMWGHNDLLHLIKNCLCSTFTLLSTAANQTNSGVARSFFVQNCIFLFPKISCVGSKKDVITPWKPNFFATETISFRRICQKIGKFSIFFYFYNNEFLWSVSTCRCQHLKMGYLSFFLCKIKSSLIEGSLIFYRITYYRPNICLMLHLIQQKERN